MSDTNRVRAWRDRLKQEGRVPMTIWVTAQTKARYDDLALTYHRSPSELAQQALDAYRPDAVVSVPVSDTEPLHVFIRAEIAQLMADARTAVTETVTATLLTQLQKLVQAAMVAGVSATETDTDAVTGRVTATGADTETVTPPREAVRAPVTAPLADTATVTPGKATGAPPVTAPVTATSTDTLPLAYDPDAAYARMQVLQGQGLSLAQIAAQLTAEGVGTKRGRPWHRSSVRYILQTHGR